MRRCARRLAGLATVTLAAFAPAAFAVGVGAPPIALYGADDYGARAQCYAAVLGADGLMYFGNRAGVLRFDGSEWTLLPSPNQGPVRRVIATEDGTLYAATIDDLLRYRIGTLGVPQAERLAPGWPEAVRVFGEPFYLDRARRGIYLQSTPFVIRANDDGGVVHWTSERGFLQAASVGDAYYVVDRDRGLLWVDPEGDPAALVPAPDGESWRGDQLTFALRARDGRLVFHSRKRNMLVLEEGRFVPWPTEIDAWASKHVALHGVELSDGSLMLGSALGGIAWIEPDGRLRRYLDAREGFSEGAQMYLYAEGRGAVWSAGDTGLARIAVDSPATVFDKRHGVPGVWGIGRYADRVWLATRAGVFVSQDAEPGRPARFARLAAEPTQAWFFLPMEDALWIGGSDAVWRIEPRADTNATHWPVSRVYTTRNIYELLRARDGAIWGATATGLVRLVRAGETWRTERIGGFESEARHLVEDASGNVWAGTPAGKVLHASREASGWRLDVLDADDGVPSGSVWTFASPEGVVVATPIGLHRIVDGRLVAAGDAAHGSFGTGSRETRRWLTARDGTHYAQIGGRVVRSRGGLDALAWEAVLPLDLREEPVYAFHEDAEGVVWIGRETSLVRFDPAPAAALPVLSRPAPRLTGIEIDPAVALDGDGTVPAGVRRLRFRYALPVFAGATGAEFRTRLAGIDAEWSPWSRERQRDYTQLGGGAYRFEVEARDRNGAEYGRASRAFTVATPWYARPAAFALWIALVVAAVALAVRAIVRWRETLLVARNRELETIVAERTDQLRQQTDRLVELDRAKSRFFASITHDLRSPLTLVLEPLRELARGTWGPVPSAVRTELERAGRNAAQLRRLVEQILDLQALDSEGRRLAPTATPLGAVLRATAAQYEGHAARRGIALALTAPDRDAYARVDADALVQVLANLLDNAFKYTRDGGRIALSVDAGDDTTHTIAVTDDGAGIAPDELPHVFDRFYRSRRAEVVQQPGSGLGLALVRELVERQGGRVAIESTLGAGTTVRVTLPACEPLAATGTVSETVSAYGARTSRTAETVSDTVPDDSGLHVSRMSGEDATTVLVVDDNVELRAFLRERLRHHYRVLEAGDGDAALALATHELPDLVVSDVQMPKRDGIGLLRALRAQPETDVIPVLLLASRGGVEARIGGITAGADDYLVKPFDAGELIARIAGLIASRRQLRARYAGPQRADTRPVDPFLAKVHDAIHARLDDSAFGVTELADALHVERTTLFKRLKALGEPAPVHLIREVRLDAAAAMLTHARAQVTEVAYACGFESLSYFSRSFKARFGHSPSEHVRTDKGVGRYK